MKLGMLDLEGLLVAYKRIEEYGLELGKKGIEFQSDPKMNILWDEYLGMFDDIGIAPSEKNIINEIIMYSKYKDLSIEDIVTALKALGIEVIEGE